MRKRNPADILFDAIVYVLLTILLFLVAYPFWYVLIVSLNNGQNTAAGGMYWLPRDFVLDNYLSFFTDAKWLNGLKISVLRTSVGTFFGVLITTLVSYGLSFPDLLFRKVYMSILVVSMYFSGGIIPYYLLLREIGLLNTFWVYVIPGALSVFFVLVGISFFSEISPSLRESALIDGASEVAVFLRIIVPISMPFVATIILFLGVGHWNNWFDSAFFMRKKELRTMAYLMMEVINKTQINSNMNAADMGMRTNVVTPLSIQSAAMMISILPILCIYPFLQKYFVKGIMVGSVKE